MKEKVLEEECIVDGNSLFIINAKYIYKVHNENDNKLKFIYNIHYSILTVFGIHDSIYVIYE